MSDLRRIDFNFWLMCFAISLNVWVAITVSPLVLLLLIPAAPLAVKTMKRAMTAYRAKPEQGSGR